MSTAGTSKQYNNKPFWQRGFIPLVVTFLVGSWTFLEFLNFILERYLISHTWVDISLVLLSGLFPSVLLYSWTSTSGRDNLFKFPNKWIYMTNIILIVGLTIVIFRDKELGNQQEVIQIHDEYGVIKNINHFKPEFMDRIAVFEFKPRNSESPEWLRFGIPLALETDLGQFDGILTDINYGINLSEREKYSAAKNSKSHLIVDGYADFDGTEYFIEVSLSNKSGKVLETEQFKGSRVLPLVDSITSLINNNISNSEYISNQIDLSLSGMLSENDDAIKAFMANKMNLALEIDSTFSAAALVLARDAYFFSQGDMLMAEYIDKAYKWRKKVSMSFDLLIRAFYFLSKNEVDKAIVLFDDYEKIVPNYKLTIVTLENLYLSLERYAEVIKLFENILDENPDDIRLQIQLSDAYMLSDRLDEAHELLVNIINSGSGNISVKYRLTINHILSNRFEEAKKIIDQINLEDPTDRVAQILGQSIIYYEQTSRDVVELNQNELLGTYLAEGYNQISIRKFRNALISKFENQKAVINVFINDTTIFGSTYSTDISLIFEWTITPLRSRQNISGLEMKQLAGEQKSYYQLFKFDPRLKMVLDSIDHEKFSGAQSILDHLIKEYPEHYYLHNIANHIKFVLENKYILNEQWNQQFVGNFNNRSIFIKDGQLMYKRNSIFKLWQIAPDKFMLPPEYDFLVEIIREKDTVSGIMGWYYNHDSGTYEPYEQDISLKTK